MLKKNEIIELKIDSLTYGGEGIGKYEGIAVFVPDVVPGDLIKAELISVKKNYAKAIKTEVIEPSKCRVKPFCALTNVCGGCQWQHIKYEEQLKAKRQIVEDSLKRIGGIEIPVKEVIGCKNHNQYRCKVQYPVGQTKVSKRFLAGYYKKGTHEIINIKHCPIQPELIDKITAFIREKAQESTLSAYNEKKHKGWLRHVVYRYSHSEKKLLVIFVLNHTKIPNKMLRFCEAVKNEFDQIEGVLVNFNTSKSNVIMGKATELAAGKDYICEKLEDKVYKISAGSFFQVNVESAVNIFNEVKNIISERVDKPTILDAYAGVGSFSIWLKDIASKITAVEEYPNAIKDAKYNLKANKAHNIEVLEGDAQVIFEKFKNDNKTFDVTVLDPPRKGCSEAALNIVSELTNKYIIYVSCNPTTLARDLKILKEKGFTPEYVQPVDMFCHTYHIESIVVLKK